jgi:hypothetical protein
MHYCSQCQLVHGEEHRFCQRCGQLLKGSQAATAHTCARCGMLTFPGQKFCTECGLPLRVARPAPEGEPASPRPPLFYPRRAEGSKAARSRQRRPGRALVTLIALLLIVLASTFLWRQLPARGPVARTPATAAPQEDLRREVEKVAEKIRAAHLNKDINRWLSCYSTSYPNLGGLEGQILEIWKNFDVKDVSYRISNVQRLGDRQVSADILWNIQFYDHRTHDYTLDRSSYKIVLEKDQDGWKIQKSILEGTS